MFARCFRAQEGFYFFSNLGLKACRQLMSLRITKKGPAHLRVVVNRRSYKVCEDYRKRSLITLLRR
jgi:hypothetical protein